LALYHHIYIGAGVVEADFRGDLSVVLFDHSEKPFIFSRGDGMAALICEKIYYYILHLFLKENRMKLGVVQVDLLQQGKLKKKNKFYDSMLYCIAVIFQNLERHSYFCSALIFQRLLLYCIVFIIHLFIHVMFYCSVLN
jgi:hypothetical protein